MSKFCTENHLISHNWSELKEDDSCNNQFLLTTHKICKSFDDSTDICGVFFDLSVALEKLWHNCLLYKLKQNGISCKLLDTLTDFSDFGKQKFYLDGQLELGCS